MNTLPSRVHDSQNGLNYTLVGNYYLPDLEIESSQPIGKFGRARMKYLKEYRPGLYSRLLLSGKLYDDLNEVDAEAQRLLDQMIPQMAAEAGINEDLKAADQMRWVGMMNTIKAHHPNANLVAIDYDPGASQVNQQNRIKLMLANIREEEKQADVQQTKTEKTARKPQNGMTM